MNEYNFFVFGNFSVDNRTICYQCARLRDIAKTTYLHLSGLNNAEGQIRSLILTTGKKVQLLSRQLVGTVSIF